MRKYYLRENDEELSLLRVYNFRKWIKLFSAFILCSKKKNSITFLIPKIVVKNVEVVMDFVWDNPRKLTQFST